MKNVQALKNNVGSKTESPSVTSFRKTQITITVLMILHILPGKAMKKLHWAFVLEKFLVTQICNQSFLALITSLKGYPLDERNWIKISYSSEPFPNRAKLWSFHSSKTCIKSVAVADWKTRKLQKFQFWLNRMIPILRPNMPPSAYITWQYQYGADSKLCFLKGLEKVPYLQTLLLLLKWYISRSFSASALSFWCWNLSVPSIHPRKVLVGSKTKNLKVTLNSTFLRSMQFAVFLINFSYFSIGLVHHLLFKNPD